MQTELKIDLSEFQPELNGKISRVFIGRDLALRILKETNLIEIEPNYSKIIFLVPSKTLTLSVTFLLELLSPFLIKLKEEMFLNKFQFEGIEIKSELKEVIRICFNSSRF